MLRTIKKFLERKLNQLMSFARKIKNRFENNKEDISDEYEADLTEEDEEEILDQENRVNAYYKNLEDECEKRHKEAGFKGGPESRGKKYRRANGKEVYINSEDELSEFIDTLHEKVKNKKRNK